MTRRPRKKIFADFYKSDSGRQPVREWLLRLTRADRQIIGKDLQKVEFGWPIGMPYCRSLGRGLWEVRSDISNGRTARVIFCNNNDRMVLLHGFVKKSQKTPKQEIDTAFERMKGGRK